MSALRALKLAFPRIALTARLAVPTVRPIATCVRTPLVASRIVIRRPQSSEAASRAAASKEETPKVYTYEAIKQLSEHPVDSKVIVDVREPAELEEGYIPGAVNIPFKSAPGALDLSPEEFEEEFKFKKPSKDKELVFYCLAGVRSTAAADLAQIFGYKKLGNYVGSWEDWVSHEQADKSHEK